MDLLPREVILDLLSRLPITSLIRFRYASKSCYNLSLDPHLVNLHAAKKNTTCLFFHLANHLQFVEFSDLNDYEIVRRIEPPHPMPQFDLLDSSNGLLCLSTSINHDVIHLFNPFTRNYLQLPELPELTETSRAMNQRVLVGFGFHPLTNQYKVVRIVYYHYRNVDDKFPLRRSRYVQRREYSQSGVQVYTAGSNHWRYIGNMPYQIEPHASKPLLVNGRLHWLTRSGRGANIVRSIISFDLADEQFRLVTTLDFGGIRMNAYQLAVLEGRLSVVVHHPPGNMEIWVMQEYGVIDSWSRHLEIGVIDSNTRVLCQTKNGQILLNQGGGLALYDLQSTELNNVNFEGMPDLFQAIVHEGSLAWISNV